ncbi:uroporphyrinogen-III synthase [Dyella caseinilytica]|uniref:Uroporphyrinogen-III synthase n=1 Tax=Dyella caseinilytica TaxID=1849581 RepID=A0ABX7GUI6_9GAMM|nr:uroporphyrinogen-III synthase [Dyella caseinilytica]QRN54116.1 uroporphyrinogen-III synthase [Dyella caseinilytica]GFZ91652.1 uroporphyrinogen III methyltransferase [Dyella caseinilytica]
MASRAPPTRSVRASAPLAGRTIVITRPAGTGSPLARRVRALGGTPLLLPGLSLRAEPDPEQARAQWLNAQLDDVLIFTSPAAVRYALALAPCETHAAVMAVGRSTARALLRHGIEAQTPATQQNSEGVLQLPSMQQLKGRRVALITAPSGRGLLQEQIVARGGLLREVHVYGRGAPHLNRRHVEAILQLPADACVLLSSGEAIQHLMAALPAQAQQRLCSATAVVSSPRIAEQAQVAGFEHLHMAASATQGDLLAAAVDICSRPRHEASRAGC